MGGAALGIESGPGVVVTGGAGGIIGGAIGVGLGAYYGGELGAQINESIVEPMWRRNEWTGW